MAKLTTKKRDAMKASTFAVPKERAYPINDEAHAKAALQRVSQFGSAEEKKKVRAAVAKKFPAIEQTKGAAAKKAAKK
jgi:hypothetical protein